MLRRQRYRLEEQTKTSSNAVEWRNRQVANRTIHVSPEDCPLLTGWRNVDQIATNLSHETGISVVLEVGSQGITFLLYGQGLELEAAVRHINKWIDNGKAKAVASKTWSKSSAFDWNQWYNKEVKLLEYSRKAQFKRSPPKGLPCKLLLAWPEELQLRDITPQNAFGLQLEALDSIRMEDEVYISLHVPRAGEAALLFQGNSQSDVELAKRHALNLVNKVKGKFHDVELTLIILDKNEGSEVTFDAPLNPPFPTKELAPRLKVDPVMQEGLRSHYEHSLSPDVLSLIQHRVRCALESIRYERGFYDLSIRLGAFVVETASRQGVVEQGKTLKLAELLSQCEAGVLMKPRVHRWVGDYALEMKLLERLRKADWFLEPVGSKTGGFSGGLPAASLKEVEPTLHASLKVQEIGIRESNSIHVIEFTWTKDEDGIYEKMVPKFFKFQPQAKETESQPPLRPKQHLDVKLVELAGSRAWQIDLESMIPLVKSAVPPAVVTFANSVILKPECVKRSNFNQNFITFPNRNSVKFLHGRLDQVYTFGVTNTDYRIQAREMRFSGSKEPRWGCYVHHQDWKMRLAELERLPPGECGDFGNTIETFFPRNADEKITEVNEIAEMLDMKVSDFPPGTDLFKLAGLDDHPPAMSLLDLLDMEVSEIPPATKGIDGFAKLLGKISRVITGN